MPDTVKNPYTSVFDRLGADVIEAVGDNFSMSDSQTPAKFPYIQLQYLGAPKVAGDLEGDECATSPSFQIDCYDNSVLAGDKVWELDDICHKAMTNMGFERTYQQPVPNADPTIKRVTSRYIRRVFTGKLLGE